MTISRCGHGRGKKLGWFVEPTYGYSFSKGHEQAAAVSARLLIPIPYRDLRERKTRLAPPTGGLRASLAAYHLEFEAFRAVPLKKARVDLYFQPDGTPHRFPRLSEGDSGVTGMIAREYYVRRAVE